MTSPKTAPESDAFSRLSFSVPSLLSSLSRARSQQLQPQILRKRPKVEIPNRLPIGAKFSTLKDLASHAGDEAETQNAGDQTLRRPDT